MRTECPLPARGSNSMEWSRGAAGAGDANQTSKPGTRPNTSQLRVNSSIGQCGEPQYQEEQRNEREKGRRRVKECLPENSRSLERRNGGSLLQKHREAELQSLWVACLPSCCQGHW